MKLAVAARVRGAPRPARRRARRAARPPRRRSRRARRRPVRKNCSSIRSVSNSCIRSGSTSAPLRGRDERFDGDQAVDAGEWLRRDPDDGHCRPARDARPSRGPPLSPPNRVLPRVMRQHDERRIAGPEPFIGEKRAAVLGIHPQDVEVVVAHVLDPDALRPPRRRSTTAPPPGCRRPDPRRRRCAPGSRGTRDTTARAGTPRYARRAALP